MRTTEAYEAAVLQTLINSGAAWRLEGAVGRAAMEALKAGLCMLPEEPHRDYYGNTVPARSWLVPGAFGTREYVVELHGEEWAQILEDATDRTPYEALMGFGEEE